MTAGHRALKWVACTGCGSPTRPKTGPLCSLCREQGPPVAEDAPEAEEPVDPKTGKRRRRVDSGWCQSGFHGRCVELLQEANGHRPEIHCGCRCHKLTRNMAWAQRR